MLLTFLTAAPLLCGGVPDQPAPPPDPLEGGAWLKIFGIVSGAPEPVVLSEAEVNALLRSAQLRAVFAERAGLTDVAARLFPGEVHFRGRLETSRLAAALGPLAPPAGSPAQPVALVMQLQSATGLVEARLLRGTVSGVELPPPLLAEAVAEALATVLGAQLPTDSRPTLDGTPFPLPDRIERLEVRSGEILLLPAAP